MSNRYSLARATVIVSCAVAAVLYAPTRAASYGGLDKSVCQTKEAARLCQGMMPVQGARDGDAAIAAADCGHRGQRACRLTEGASPCGPGLVNRGGFCDIVRKIPGQTPCGGRGRPACPRELRRPACDAGFIPRGGICVPIPCTSDADPRCRPKQGQ